MKPILLIGHRCTGKTSGGKKLAARLDCFFVDTDDVIEDRTGKTIRELVEEGGWPLFRKEEKKVLRDMVTQESRVIATGGGAFDDRENRELAKRSNILIIWLKADTETIVGRMKADATGRERRPSLIGTDDVRTETAAVLERRTPFYGEIAHHVVDTMGKTVDEVVDNICTLIQEDKESSCQEIR